MILTKRQEEILNVMCNDVKVKDIGFVMDLSTSSIEKELSEVKDFNNIETNHGLIAQYLYDLNDKKNE